MTWLITGGHGQLGIALSRQLRIKGMPYLSWGSSELDITDVEKVKSTLGDLNPSVVVNCAAWTDVEEAEKSELEAFRVNAEGAENVAIGAKACGAKLIHISTDYVFSGDSQLAWRTDDNRNPRTAYGRTKLAGEERVIGAYEEGTLLIRTAWLYSPWKKNFLKTILRLVSENASQIRIVNDQIGQPTSAIDLATRIIEVAESRIESGVFHGTNSGSATWFEFAREIMRIRGEDLTRLKSISSFEFEQLAPRPKFSVLDHSAWKNFGFDPMQDWKTALQHTMMALESKETWGLRNA